MGSNRAARQGVKRVEPVVAPGKQGLPDRPGVAEGLLLLAAVAFYWQAADIVSVEPEDFSRMFSGSQGSWSALLSPDYFLAFHNQVYRPLTSVFHRLCWASFGTRLPLYPWAKIALLWVVGVCVYKLARGIFAQRRWAAAAALLYLAHPLHLAGLTRLSSVDDQLMTLFCLAALLAHRRHRERGCGFALGWEAAAYGAALLSKETALVYPALAFLDDLARPRSPGPARRLLRDYGMLIAVTGAFLALLAHVSAGQYGALQFFPESPWWQPLQRLARYLSILALPGTFAPRPEAVWAGCAFLAALLAQVVWRVSPWQGLLCAGWLILPLLPVVDLVAVSSLPGYLASQTWPARYLTLPLAGASLLTISALAALPPKGRLRHAGAAAAALLLSLCATMSVRGFRHRAAAAAGDLQQAFSSGSRAPDRPVRNSRLESALLTLPEIRRRQPDLYARARSALGPAAELFADRVIYSRTESIFRALDALSFKGLDKFERDLAAAGSPAAFLDRLDGAARRRDEGIALFQAGDGATAQARLREALALEPDDPWTLMSLGAVLSRSGRTREARAAYERALGLRLEDDSLRTLLRGARDSLPRPG